MKGSEEARSHASPYITAYNSVALRHSDSAATICHGGPHEPIIAWPRSDADGSQQPILKGSEEARIHASPYITAYNSVAPLRPFLMVHHTGPATCVPRSDAGGSQHLRLESSEDTRGPTCAISHTPTVPKRRSVLPWLAIGAWQIALAQRARQSETLRRNPKVCYAMCYFASVCSA